MLKKAGIVVALSTATLLAVSPLAFAGSSGHGEGKGSKNSNKQTNNSDSSRNRSSSGGLLNVDALNGDILNNANICPNVNVDVIKLLGVLGSGSQSQGTTCVNSNNNTNQSNDER